MITRRLFAVSTLVVALAHAGAANAQDAGYPAKPITIVVPWAAGGAADFIARTVGQRLSERLHQPVLVDNKPGAGTNIGTQLVAGAKPDGYTLLMASSNNCVNVTLLPPAGVDFGRDFKPIANVGLAPNVLVVHPQVAATDMKQLLALAKAQPGKLTYGSSGTGSAAHLAAEKLKLQAGVDIVGVPYKGAAPAVTDLLGGHLSMMFTVIPATLPHVQSGKLRLLAVATDKRFPMFPDVPTVAESGLPGFESSIWYGLVAPAKVSDQIVHKLNSEIVAILNEPDVRKRMGAQGVVPIGNSPSTFAATIKADIAQYAELIRSARIRAD
ncbi:MAG: tripartite tricarboxylate transporter substrate binding protein [Solimonas sp.]